MKRHLRDALDGRGNLVAASALSELVSSLARTVVLARILPPDQLGVAVALALTLSMAEIFAEIGLDRSIIRLNPGTDPNGQRGTLHALAVIRGVILALLLAGAAPVLAAAFQSAASMPAFLVLAVCPLIKGVAHLGPKEQMRAYAYGPDAFATIILHAMTMLATIGAALVLRSYWAAPVGLVVGLVVYVLTTHLLALSPWRLAWRKDTARDALHFGAPLVPNGVSLGLKSLGDRLIVGAVMGPAALAFYNLTMMVGVMPRTIALRYLTTVFLPHFVHVEPGRGANLLAGAFALLSGAIGLAIGLGLWSLGGPVIALIFGAAYLPGQALIGATAALVAVRMLYAVITLPAMASGGTNYILVGSVGSLLGVGCGGLVLWLTRDLTFFVLTMAAVEFLTLLLALHVGRAALSLQAGLVVPAIMLPPLILLALTGSEMLIQPVGWPWRCGVAIALALTLLLAVELSLRRVGSSLMKVMKTLREKPPAPLAGPPGSSV